MKTIPVIWQRRRPDSDHPRAQDGNWQKVTSRVVLTLSIPGLPSLSPFSKTNFFTILYLFCGKTQDPLLSARAQPTRSSQCCVQQCRGGSVFSTLIFNLQGRPTGKREFLVFSPVWDALGLQGGACGKRKEPEHAEHQNHLAHYRGFM